MVSTDLPALSTSCEREDLDFKDNYDPGDSLEMAKDVAALANTLGGSLLVGATSNGKQLTGFPGIPRELTNKLAENFETSVSQRCRPAPQVATQIIDLAGSLIVAVNVWPTAFAPIGVNINQKVKGARLVSAAWIFPVRVGSQTHYLQPDQLGVFENMTARRAAAQLYGIPEGEKDRLRFRWVTRSPAHSTITQENFRLFGKFSEREVDGLRTRDISLVENVAVFHAGGRIGDQLKELQIPLDAISTVWRDRSKNQWEIVIVGRVRDEDGRWIVVPNAD